MKKSQLKRIIKEEIRKVLKEAFINDKGELEDFNFEEEESKENYLPLSPEVKEYIDNYGSRSLYKAIVLVFPDAAESTIISVQNRLKIECVSRGLMIGEFFKNNQQSGLLRDSQY